MKKYLLYGLLTIFTIALAFVIGGGYAYSKIKGGWGTSQYTVQNGCWKVNAKMDLENDRFQRASVALGGLFALRESEVLYFIATQDDEGRTLDPNYEYELVGQTPDARYWSFTMYGSDHFLVPNEANKFGYNLDNIEYDFAPLDGNSHQIQVKNSHYRIVIAQEEQEKNWLPASKDDDKFVITFRLYNPAPSVYNNLENCTLPNIKRIEK